MTMRARHCASGASRIAHDSFVTMRAMRQIAHSTPPNDVATSDEHSPRTSVYFPDRWQTIGAPTGTHRPLPGRLNRSLDYRRCVAQGSMVDRGSMSRRQGIGAGGRRIGAGGADRAGWWSGLGPGVPRGTGYTGHALLMGGDIESSVHRSGPSRTRHRTKWPPPPFTSNPVGS
jgi:hypothetical protein